MRIFVTGGSGFVGGHLIEALSRSGHDVRALARSDRAAEAVRRYGATPVRGELGAVSAAMLAGAEAVVHAAAFVEEWGTREEFWEANVEGTTRLLEAARASSARRFVHVGTEAAIFSGGDLVDVDETAPYPARHRYLYAETKAEAERRVLAASGPGFATLSIRPRLVWGPRDGSVLPAVLRMARAGRFAWLDGGRARTSTTHVDNLVHALELALGRGEPGRAYFVADEGTRTIRAFLSALARTQGVDLGTRSAPSALMRPLARGVEGAWRLLGLRRPPPLTRFAIDMMSASVTVRTDRARVELGYAPVISVDEGLTRLGTSTRAPRSDRTTAKGSVAVAQHA
jgi:nucleoside-diphosphate-sugar epimerase